MLGLNEEGCDVRIWSGECEHTTYTSIKDKYLCEVCEKIPDLDHEVHRDVFVYVSGDYDNMS